MTKLHEFLRWSVVAGVLGLGAACGSTEVPLDPAATAGMTPAAARATLAALKADAGGQPRAMLWPGDPDLFAVDWELDPPDMYPVHYLVESVAVGPQQISMRTRTVSKSADNGGEFVWSIPLHATQPSLRISHDTDLDEPIVSLYASSNTTQMTFLSRDEALAQRVTAALVVLKRAAAADDATFAHTLAAWRAAAPKPVPGEDLRRLALQAKGAVGDKDFYAGEEFYAQGLEIAPWWPEGRYNRALIFAAIGDYADAVVDMQRFLALVPETPNARALQDEIYDWQRKAQAQ